MENKKKDEPIQVQISIFDLLGDKVKPGEEEKVKVEETESKEEKESGVTIKVELDADKVKEAVDDLMAVILKHELTTKCDDEGNIVILLSDLITDHINIVK